MIAYNLKNVILDPSKVKESLSRIIKAVEVFKMNFGTIYLDFFEPVHMSEMVSKQTDFDPYERKEDRLKFNSMLGN